MTPEQADKRDLIALLAWLEYGRESGYVAARCSKQQEEHWADLLRDLLYPKDENHDP